jgi:CubicO group peptidase (beta-lactamase class C family)
LLGEIIQRSTGQSFADFAEEHLFRPLGITSHRWAEFTGAPDVPFASGGLYLRPRDMAKIGQLMLRDGVWNGRRILSSDWVRRSLTMAIALFDRGHAHGYGYQWRLARFGRFTGFYAAGWGGQFVVVLPELNIVFVQTGGRFAGERIPISYATIIERYVLPALRHQ